MKLKFIVLFLAFFSLTALSEDGSKLWLRYSDTLKSVTCSLLGKTESFPAAELKKAMNGTESKKVSVLLWYGKGLQNKEINQSLLTVGNEGFVIRSVKNKTYIVANTEAGLLYGVYRFIRILQLGEFTTHLNIQEKPSYDLRILNHWDNPDGTVERGYSGHSIFKWDEIPGKISPMYEEYARANASIGINGTVLNNVNASPKMLTPEYLQKVKILADIFRKFHMKVYLSINFSSPTAIGGLPTSDPLNEEVRLWWKKKAAEIYQLIPDFGGFLVKANSEGLPGPMDYGRTHVDGANMLAEALEPFGGIIMWRAFVYEPGDDRAKLAYNEFKKFDGQFHINVIIQVKNGPIDFQPREPFSPLFGAMSQTPLMPELQITQEYLGQGTHLVFLAPMWREFLDSETYSKDSGSTIAKITKTQKNPTAIAGVANIGEDANWCGHPFAQSNWYAFGRLAWNNELNSEQIASEWAKLSFSLEGEDLDIVKNIMLESHEACVDYMMPMGLHHLFAWSHHYGPEPWCEIPGARPDWLPKYYHQADSVGLGFNRTTTGSNAVSQYFQPLSTQFNDPTLCPEKYLLWFHHIPWNMKLKNNRTMWDELCYKYDEGVKSVMKFQKDWQSLEGEIDKEQFELVEAKLKIQLHDAIWWKDACLQYFQTFSKQPFPANILPVHENLDSLKQIKLDLKHHN